MDKLQIKILDKKLPSHEQIVFGLLLTFVGGFFDSYTYINCNGIFANAQTGNLIFIGLALADGDFSTVLNFVPPISAFIVGVVFNEYIIKKNIYLPIRRYINISLLIQIFLLFFAYFVPKVYYLDTRPLIISFVCAMQFDSFRTINKIPFANTFCTGNLRSASEHIFRYIFLKERESKVKFYIYFSLIVMFLFGVVTGSVVSYNFNHHALLLVIGVLIVDFFIAIFHDMGRV
ncbi:DUF1275 domain-containing protein [Gemella sp. GH3]|nr:DUF1275 domain-containing protein [Gemella sp. GH3.1]NYS51349.1 DUF1275 domain-containing protein [Gemella sp. GH3]